MHPAHPLTMHQRFTVVASVIAVIAALALLAVPVNAGSIGDPAAAITADGVEGGELALGLLPETGADSDLIAIVSLSLLLLGSAFIWVANGRDELTPG